MRPFVADRRHHIAALDGVRGVAMLAVLFFHLQFGLTPSTFDVLDRIGRRGWTGVDLFFVLSGFLITGILIDTRGEASYFATFYKRRALRIFPIYYLLIVGLVVWLPFGSWYFAHGLNGWQVRVLSYQAWYWAYAVNVIQTLLPNTDWGPTIHLWSLSAEEQFYLLWPMVVLATPRRQLAKVCVWMIAAAVLLRASWLWADQTVWGAYVLMPMRMDSLAIGALVAVLARTTEGTAALRRWYRPIGGLALAVGVPLFALYGDDFGSLPMALAGYLVAGIASGALIVWLLNDARPRRLLEWDVLRRVGRVSYGAYLWHFPVIALCYGWRLRLLAWGGAGGLTYGVAHLLWLTSMVTLTLFVAAVSYRVIERPFLELKDRPLRRHRAAALRDHAALHSAD